MYGIYSSVALNILEQLTVSANMPQLKCVGFEFYHCSNSLSQKNTNFEMNLNNAKMTLFFVLYWCNSLPWMVSIIPL